MPGRVGYRIGEIVNIAASLESFMGRPENVDMLEEYRTTGNPVKDEEIRKENELKESIRNFISYTQLQENTLQRQSIPAMGDQNFNARLQLSRERFMAARQNQINEITEIGKKIAIHLKNAESKKQKSSEFHRFLANFAGECGLTGSKAQLQMPAIHMMYDTIQQNHRPEILHQNPGFADRKEMTLNTAAASFQPKTVDVTSLKALGSGAINTVYSYHDPDTNTERVVKIGSQHLFENPEQESSMVATSVFAERLGHHAERYDENDDRIIFGDFKFVNTVNRDVAVSRVDQMLGFGIITKTDYGITPDGQPVSVMDKAPGKEVQEWDFSEEDDPEPGVISIKDQSLINQLYELQVVDVIAGHMDRHVGNYMLNVDQKGRLKITGIDNDTSFSVKQPELVFQSGMREVFPRIQTAFDYVPEYIYDRVKDLNRDDLVRTLGGLMTTEQLNMAAARLDYLKEHFENLKTQDKVIDGPFSEDQIHQIYEFKRVNGLNANSSCYHTDIRNNLMEMKAEMRIREAQEARQREEEAQRRAEQEAQRIQQRERAEQLREKPLQSLKEVVNLYGDFQKLLNQPGNIEMLNAPKASHFSSKKKEQAAQEFDMKGTILRFCRSMAESELDVTSPVLPGERDPDYRTKLKEVQTRAVDARTHQISLMENFSQVLTAYRQNPANQKYGDPKFNRFLDEFSMICGSGGMKAKGQLKGISELYQDMENKHRALESRVRTAPSAIPQKQSHRTALNPNEFMQKKPAPSNTRAERAANYLQRQKAMSAERPRSNANAFSEKGKAPERAKREPDKGRGMF